MPLLKPQEINYEKLVREDLTTMDFADQPIANFAKHSREQYIKMAANLANQWYHVRYYNHILNPYWETELNDFIHGLNHCFMWGVSAGQQVEQNVR